MNKRMMRLTKMSGVSCFLLLLCSLPVNSQTYTTNELVAAAPLAWQSDYDSQGRLTIGPDDGNAIAEPNTIAWATTIRYGGAQGLEGLLYDFTISTEGPPRAFGLARHDCTVHAERDVDDCVRVRWEPTFGSDASSMSAVISYPDLTVVAFVVSDVHQGESFSIERMGNLTINFYRSTGVDGERQRVFSAPSPFILDGQGSTTIEARALFEPSISTRKISWASERYYCCL